MWSPWKVALFLLSLPSHGSAAYFLDSNDYYLIQNAFREHFVPTLWCGVRNAAPYSNPGWYFLLLIRKVPKIDRQRMTLK